MKKHFDHISIIFLVIIGQITGHILVNIYAPKIVDEYKPNLVSIFAGVGIGVVSLIIFYFIFCGIIYLLHKLGIVDLEKINDDHTGFN